MQVKTLPGRLRRTVLLTAVTLTLSACATHRPPPLDLSSSWPQRLQALKALEDWSFNGRLGIRAGDEAWNASLRWQQRKDRYDIRISAPLGQGAARLRGGANDVTMELPDEAPLRADNAESLLRAQLGWSVPVSGMRHWLAGRPDPNMGTEIMELDEMGRLSQLRQAGWSIEYRRYVTVDQIDLPRKIEMVNSDLRVRLMIDQWHLHEG